MSNKNIAHSRFDCKIIQCYTSYLHYYGQNGTRFGKSNEQDKNFEYNALITCRYLILVKNQKIIVFVNRKFTSRFNRLRGKRGWVYVIFFELCIKGNPFARFEWKNSDKTYNFRISVINVQMVYLELKMHFSPFLFPRSFNFCISPSWYNIKAILFDCTSLWYKLKELLSIRIVT